MTRIFSYLFNLTNYIDFNQVSTIVQLNIYGYCNSIKTFTAPTLIKLLIKF